jgi:hypothetical protein
MYTDCGVLNKRDTTMDNIFLSGLQDHLVIACIRTSVASLAVVKRSVDPKEACVFALFEHSDITGNSWEVTDLFSNYSTALHIMLARAEKRGGFWED